MRCVSACTGRIMRRSTVSAMCCADVCRATQTGFALSVFMPWRIWLAWTKAPLTFRSYDDRIQHCSCRCARLESGERRQLCKMINLTVCSLLNSLKSFLFFSLKSFLFLCLKSLCNVSIASESTETMVLFMTESVSAKMSCTPTCVSQRILVRLLAPCSPGPPFK